MEVMNEENTEVLFQELYNELVGNIDRVNKLIPLIKDIYGDLGILWDEVFGNSQRNYKFLQVQNELTHLHNEMIGVQKHLGLDGSIPKVLKSKSKYD